MEGTTMVDWNRIQIENIIWKKGRIGIQFDESGLLGLGEMYFLNPYPDKE